MATHMTAEISDVSANTTLVNMEKFTLASFRVKSFIRGYHVYKEDWEPELNEEQELKCEPQNKEDPYAVAVVRPLPRPPKDNDPGQAPCSLQKVIRMQYRETRKSLDTFLCGWLLVSANF